MNQESCWISISIQEEEGPIFFILIIIHWLHNHQIWPTLWQSSSKLSSRRSSRTLQSHPHLCLRQISSFAMKKIAMKQKWWWRLTTFGSSNKVKKFGVSHFLPHQNWSLIIQVYVILQSSPHSNNTVRRREIRPVASPTPRAKAASPVAKPVKCRSLSTEAVRVVVTEGAAVFKK